MLTTERRALIISSGKKVEDLRRESSNANQNLLPYNQPSIFSKVQVGSGVILQAKSFPSDHHRTSLVKVRSRTEFNRGDVWLLLKIQK